jgi:hypothetical protein
MIVTGEAEEVADKHFPLQLHPPQIRRDSLGMQPGLPQCQAFELQKRIN